MAWFRVGLPEDEQRLINEERESHPEPHVRCKSLSENKSSIFPEFVGLAAHASNSPFQ
jgi:hypothetical protein